MKLPKKLQNIQQWDAPRPGFKGEHWLVLGAGLLALRSAGRSRGIVGRTLSRAVGSALIARAASGRDGVLGKLARASVPVAAARLVAGRRGSR
jgi:hypothetical protein